jgi:hypothetical protein
MVVVPAGTVLTLAPEDPDQSFSLACTLTVDTGWSTDQVLFTWQFHGAQAGARPRTQVELSPRSVSAFGSIPSLFHHRPGSPGLRILHEVEGVLADLDEPLDEVQ